MTALNALPIVPPVLTRKDYFRLVADYAKTLPEKSSKPTCEKRIRVGLFFDGSNNNMERDKPKKSHTNVVRLYDAFPDHPDEGYFRYYMPGVGTPFPQIGENTESADGKAYGRGGSARIQWALIQLINAAYFAVNGGLMIPNDMARDAIEDPLRLKAGWSVVSNKQKTWFREKIVELAKHTAGRQPTITHIDVSVFGFSRGAAEARAFCHWLVDYCASAPGGELSLAGMPLSISFLGLFDTVASVGLAASIPLPVKGLMDWADGTMRIPAQVKRCVHLVAAHEIRASFPLSTARDGKTYPARVLEVVYPGAHSDVGGGYAPGDQGRSRAGIASLLSQIPLQLMYREAQKAGVPLPALDKLPEATRQEFDVGKQLQADYTRYLEHAALAAAPVEKLLEAHMDYYRRYKAKVALMETPAMAEASAQDQQDLAEGTRDFMRAHDWRRQEAARVASGDANVDWTEHARNERLLAELDKPLSLDVLHFLDTYVHDSHAGFCLSGPATDYDKQQEVRRVEQRVREGKALNPWEKKVWTARQKNWPFPLMTDADHWHMLHGAQTVVAAATRTRRERDDYFRQREVFDRS